MPAPEQQDIIKRLNNTTRRVRQIEETVRNIQEQLKSIESRLNQQKRDVTQNKETLQDRADDLEDDIQEINAEIQTIQRKMRKLVPRRELSEIEEYMDIMNPINTSFVTEDEVEDIIEDKQVGGVSKYEVNRMIERKLDELRNQQGDA